MRSILVIVFVLSVSHALSARPQLKYVELRRIEGGPRAGVTAALMVRNMIDPGPYTLTVRSCVDNQIIERLELDDEGHVLRGNSGEPLELTLAGLTWGDAVGLRLQAQGEGEHAELVVIPFPIRSEDDQGHWALLTRLDRYGSTFGLRAGGYKAGEPVQLTLSIDDESREQPMKARTDGTLETVIKTRAHGKCGGIAYVTIASESGDLPIAYNWGGLGG